MCVVYDIIVNLKLDPLHITNYKVQEFILSTLHCTVKYSYICIIMNSVYKNYCVASILPTLQYAIHTVLCDPYCVYCIYIKICTTAICTV